MENTNVLSEDAILKGAMKIIAKELLSQMLPEIKVALSDIINSKKAEENQDKVFSKSELSKLLKVSTVTIDSWERLGRLKSYRIGRRVFFKNCDVQASMQTLKKYKHNI